MPESVTPSAKAQVLRKAAALLRERGWRQGEWTEFDEAGFPVPGAPLCASAAIYVASGCDACGEGPELATYLARSTRMTVNRTLPGLGTLVGFNDEAARTADDVINLLESVASTCEAGDA